MLMTEAEWWEAVRRAGRAFIKHDAVWRAEGCFAALGDAHRALGSLRGLLLMRNQEGNAA